MYRCLRIFSPKHHFIHPKILILYLPPSNTSLSKPLKFKFSMLLLVFPGRALISPRVDYNEWLPVGKADPLKNEPTFDYSPPILDRVHYWGDTTKDKKDILLLGVSSKRNLYTQPNTNHVMQNEPQPSNRRNFYMSEVWYLDI